MPSFRPKPAASMDSLDRPKQRRQPGDWDFAIFALAQLSSFTGSWMQKAAVGWLVWELTRSPAWVGAVALSDLIAAVLVGPLSGAVTDRANPYRLILLTQSTMMVNTLALWLLLYAGALTPGLLLAWAVLDSCLKGFNQPVRIVVIASLAKPGRMGQAIAANSVAANLARILGPAVAGVVMLRSDVGNVFLLNLCLYATMLSVVLYLRRVIDEPRPVSAGATLLSDVRVGFGYIRGDAHMSVLFLLVVSFSFLARPFAELLPALAGGAFSGGPGTLALFMIAQGAGALLGAIWLLKPKPDQTLMRLIYASALGIGVVLVLFSLSSDLTLALTAIGLAGLFHVICNIGMQTIAQTVSLPAMRGRVVALYWLLFRACPALGAFLLGLLAEGFGLQGLVGAAAGIFLVSLAFLWPRTRRTFGL